jgi:hypothetical protein
LGFCGTTSTSTSSERRRAAPRLSMRICSSGYPLGAVDGGWLCAAMVLS